ncbi:hypothetical protein QE364_002904 [Nocardioides zeae]|uniref:Uncharacterized protein n=1 Tax=Nocardioides zeae TaxID=1457234 RepID=A0ACC6IKM3_9ACTN|nr:hypothetical protein [Nocardioides zeae]MDR6175325.1 hypothetical protein [Nocardioides zeae]MDR6211183.1 hypothetical protein [Nocardioides zeae]
MTALPTRRTVLRTAVWTVPAVSVVAAAPAFAVSGGAPTSFVSTGGGFARYNPSSGWALEAFFTILPSQASVPAVQFSAAGGPVLSFDSGTSVSDWGEGAYRFDVSGVPGSWSQGQNVTFTFFLAGLPPVTNTFTAQDLVQDEGIPGGGGDDWGI